MTVMTDIVKITVEFEASESKRFRMYSGAFVRGFVYWVLGRMNREFARQLHSSKSIAPFAVTPVMLDGTPVDRMEEGKLYNFSVTFFVPEIGEALKSYLTSTDNIYFTATGNPLKKVAVRYCDVASLSSNAVRKFRVDFITPCYFRLPSETGYRFVPLPLPDLMFRSLARLYSAFVSEISQEYRKWLDRGGVAVSGLKIKTEKVMLKKGNWAIGFVGTVNFSLPDDTYDEEFSETTSKLLKFGELSNVGGSRTSGLGVIRVRKRL